MATTHDDEPNTDRLLRRALSLAALVVACALLAALAPALLVVTAIVDVVQGARLALTRTLLMVLTWLAYELAGVLIAGWLWLRGGSAERSGKVLAGDVIVAIDDKDVRGKGVSEMRNFIVGPEGSTVHCLAPPAPLLFSHFAAARCDVLCGLCVHAPVRWAHAHACMADLQLCSELPAVLFIGRECI